MKDTAYLQHVYDTSKPFDKLIIECCSFPHFAVDVSSNGWTIEVSRPSPELLAALRKVLGPEPSACADECEHGTGCPCYQAGLEEQRDPP